MEETINYIYNKNVDIKNIIKMKFHVKQVQLKVIFSSVLSPDFKPFRGMSSTKTSLQGKPVVSFKC